jgi:hypothetical protein
MVQNQATYQDADLLLKLYDTRREERLRAARAWFMKDFSASSFAEAMEKYPPGSDHNAYMRMVGTYWDMAAAFVVRGVLHEELFFETSNEMLMVWEKLKNFIEDLRRVRSNPTLYRNLEKGAKKYIEWLNHQAPGAHAALQAMVSPKK